jgi:hypothetical protein
MNQKRDFRQAASEAKGAGLLPLSSQTGKSKLEEWVAQVFNIPKEERKELEYALERVALEDASEKDILLACPQIMCQLEVES